MSYHVAQRKFWLESKGLAKLLTFFLCMTKEKSFCVGKIEYEIWLYFKYGQYERSVCDAIVDYFTACSSCKFSLGQEEGLRNEPFEMLPV